MFLMPQQLEVSCMLWCVQGLTLLMQYCEQIYVQSRKTTLGSNEVDFEVPPGQYYSETLFWEK